MKGGKLIYGLFSIFGLQQKFYIVLISKNYYEKK